jgi:hypothetical protein
MPIPIQRKCPRCKGETDMEGRPCMPCAMKEIMKFQGFKHVPSSYFPPSSSSSYANVYICVGSDSRYTICVKTTVKATLTRNYTNG